MNRGQGGDSPGGGTAQLGRSLTSMTVGEIKQLQATGGVNAVGRYQFIKGTLIEAAEAAGITDDMPFNEAVQDRMFLSILTAMALMDLGNSGGFSKVESIYV